MASVKRHLVSILAVVAALGVLISWVLDVIFRLKPISTLPIMYDLCLAYLIGWLFHWLVVVIPERRRVRSIMQTLSGNLMMIANNGADLIRDLEFLGRCPQRPVTRDHVFKICVANDNTDSMGMYMSARLSVARDAYSRVTPFLASLPHDVAVAIQEVDQQFINLSYNVPDHLVLGDTDRRFPWPRQPTTGDSRMKRYTMQGWQNLIFRYYTSTETVRAAVKPFIEGAGGRSERMELLGLQKINDRNDPITYYPEEASTDAW